MDTVEQFLRHRITMGDLCSLPMVVERFILRNGQAMEPMKRIGRKAAARVCFQNATNNSMRGVGPYVEGFAMSASGFPVQHAWNCIDGKAMDSTWPDAERCSYFGVVFPDDVLCDEIGRLKHYGLLETYRGANTDFIFRRDPALREIVTDIVKQRRVAA